MGIRCLFKYCFENNCTEQVDLVEVARQREGIEILVDLNSFKYYLLEAFLKSFNRNPYLQICGAEYASIKAFISKFITDLKSVGITLVFFVDGSRGSCSDTIVNKWDTFIKYRKQHIRMKMKIFDVCKGNQSIFSVTSDQPPIPTLYDTEMFSIIKKCECELVQCVSGEADHVIAKELQEREKAFAILSNDSDFCIFRGSQVIPIRGCWDIKEQINWPKRPEHLRCEMITSDKLRQQLGFDDVDHLVEMSIIVGNDFTGAILQEQGHDVTSLYRFQEAAQLIRKYRTLDNNPHLAKMTDNEKFQKAVEHSRKFFKMELTDDVDSSCKDETTLIIEEGIRSGQLSDIMKSFNNGFFWRKVLLEDSSQSVHEALRPLRSYIYKMVLPRDNNYVTEYESTWEEVMEFQVEAAKDNEVPRIQDIDKERTADNKKHFHHIMTCMDPAFDPNKTWFDRYETKKAFKCYLLRFILVLNWEKNLRIKESEFFALVAVVFGNEDEKTFHQIELYPDVRCLTISTWFQEIYDHVYSLLGKNLYLSEEFSLPHETFSGSVWTTFYHCSDDQDGAFKKRHLDEPLLEKQARMRKILFEQREIIKQLTEGIFPFNYRSSLRW